MANGTITETLFQYVWKYKLFNTAKLKTTKGEGLEIIHPGIHNLDAGPDFSQARVRIDHTTLVGNIELHLRTSDWHLHKHQFDAAYQQIILHDVYMDDDPGSLPFPTLELKGLVSEHTIDQYANLISSGAQIGCAGQQHSLSPLAWESWLSRMLTERWEEKTAVWEEHLKQLHGDWRALLFHRLAYAFGFKTNSDAFLLLALSIPLSVLIRHKDNLVQIEALLFGQSGLLVDCQDDDYVKILRQEYFFLSGKYQLKPLKAHVWKFSRMRPSNFPSVRMAQLAMFIHKSIHMFSSIVEDFDTPQLISLFDLSASDYWDDHYLPGKKSETSEPKKIGMASIENLIFNAIAPVRFMYAAHHGTYMQQEKAVDMLAQIPAESNKITRLFSSAGYDVPSALHAQAMIQLYQKYCMPRRCLECSVGLSLLRHRPNEG